MDCKKCGNFVAEGEAFCRRCGTSATPAEPTGPACVRCKRPVQEGLKFCNHCGMPLDGSGVCAVCREIIPAGTDFCARCGSRTDGKVECQKCHTLLERGTTFCGNCGEQQAVQQIVRQPAQAIRKSPARSQAFKSETGYDTVSSGNGRYLRGGKIKDGKVYKLVKTWTITGILLLAFIFSFFAFPKTTMKVKMDDYTINVEVKGNPIRAIEALFHLGDDEYEYYEMMDELYDEIEEKVDARGWRASYNLSTDYNILKILAAQAGGIEYYDDWSDVTVEISRPDIPAILLLLAQAIIPIVLIVFCLIFFIFSLLQSVRATTKGTKTDDKKDISRLVIVMGLLITGLIITKLVYGAAETTLLVTGWLISFNIIQSGFAKTIIILSVLAIICLITAHYLFTDAELNIVRLISQGVAIILFAVVFGGLGANAVVLDEFIYKDMFLSGFWSFLIHADIMNFSSSISVIGYVIGMISLVIFALLLVFSIKALSSSLSGALRPDLKANGKSAILQTVFSLVLLILTVVGVVLVNVDNGENLLKIAAWPIVVSILCVVNMVQSLVMANVDKKIRSRTPAAPQY